jgi:hypothetical protein
LAPTIRGGKARQRLRLGFGDWSGGFSASIAASCFFPGLPVGFALRLPEALCSKREFAIGAFLGFREFALHSVVLVPKNNCLTTFPRTQPICALRGLRHAWKSSSFPG